MTYNLPEIASHFSMPGDFQGAAPCGHGHINDTFEVRFDQAGVDVRYVIQRINHNVFKQPALVMDNIIRVTTHIAHKLREAGEDEITRRVLTLVPCKDGNLWHQDDDGNHWRGYIYVERAEAHNHVDSPNLAVEAARAFGKFQHLLTDLPGPRLADTIPNFHNTRSRYDALMRTVQENPAGRLSSVQAHVDWVREREWVADELLTQMAKGELKERITHNDTKINNVMIDDETGEGICVMDLDTVMPGLVLYDFGDLVRTTAISTAEDSLGLERVEARLPMFEALVRGYLSSAGAFLTSKETEFLAFSGKLITFETAIRFLTDYLNGDKYFKIHRPHHNLDRFKVQARLVESIEKQERQMEGIVSTCLKSAV